MANRLNAGFEWGTFGEDLNLSYGGSGLELSTTIKRSGNCAAAFYGGAPFSNWLRWGCSLTTELIIQFAIYFTTLPLITIPIFRWRNGTTVLGGIQIAAGGASLDFYADDFATLVGSLPFSLNSFQIIELRLKIAALSGIIQARRDMGELGVSFGGNTGIIAIDNLEWGNSHGGYMYLDDVVVNDTSGSRNNSWPGGLRIIRLAPSGDGGTLQFTPTPGPDHYAAVDEPPPSGADNLVAATAGLVDELVLTDCPADVYSIAAVQPMAFGLKTSSNPPTRLALGLKIGGTDYYGGNLDLATSQAVAKGILEESPANPGDPFTRAEIDSASMLIKSVA